MKFSRNTTWEEVFEEWRRREASNPGWIECATKVKGWENWEVWRRFSASLINADQRKWETFEIENPMEEIPEMLVGPYSGWQQRYPDKNNCNNFTFSELLEIPGEADFWRQHGKVKDMMSNFPAPTEFIGLVREDNNRVVCFEGNHRAMAIALAKKDGLKIDFATNPTIALARLSIQEIGLLDKMLKRGSTKDEPV